MKLNCKAKVWRMAVVLLLAAILAPAGIFTEARDKSRQNRDKFERKADKFINGHDARDGRLDGRGPRRNRNSGNCDSCDEDFDARRRSRPRRR